MDMTKINSAVNCSIIPRNPQILVRNAKTVDVIVAHVVILWEYDLNTVSADCEFLCEPKNNVSKTADFRD